MIFSAVSYTVAQAGQTAVWLAACCGRTHCLTLLFAKGANVNAASNVRDRVAARLLGNAIFLSGSRPGVVLLGLTSRDRQQVSGENPIGNGHKAQSCSFYALRYLENAPI